MEKKQTIINYQFKSAGGLHNRNILINNQPPQTQIPDGVPSFADKVRLLKYTISFVVLADNDGKCNDNLNDDNLSDKFNTQ